MADGWSLEDVPDLDGKRIVVTGANSGIGLEAVRIFAARGAAVVMACRSADRGAAAADEIRADVPAADLVVMTCDLADLESIAGFARTYTSEYDELHVLCNNAGVMAVPRRETADGFEYQFGVNHLGHFALTGRLLDTLAKTPGEARVVTQSSNAHRGAALDFEDLQSESGYNRWKAYSQSKLANVLFAREFDRRCKTAGLSVASVACHPGFAATNLHKRMVEATGSRLLGVGSAIATKLLAQSARAGALPMVYAATHPDLDGSEYVGPDGRLHLRGDPERQTPAATARDEETAERLWGVSADLTGVTYDFDVPGSDIDRSTVPK